MFASGTLINTAAVIVGGFIGITLKKGIPERHSHLLMQACGLSTIFIGAGGVLSKMLVMKDGNLETQGTMLLIFSLVIGSFLGSILDIETRLENIGEFLKKKLKNENDSTFVEGFVTCTLITCVGAMAIVGSLEDGLTGNFSTLAAKSVLDFVIVIIFGSTLGKGVIFSALPIFFYQGGITVAAALLGNFMTEGLISDLSFVGSALIFCIGSNLAFGKKFPVGNMLPALLIPALYAGIQSLL